MSKWAIHEKKGSNEETGANQSRHHASFSRVVLRYTLFQIPSLVILILLLVIIRRWFDLPGWLTGLCIGVWVLKDIVLFPFVWRAYEPHTQKHSQKMIGKRARVVERLDPQGYVELNGELWRAMIEGEIPPLEKDAPVRILDVKGLTLIVASESESSP